MALIPALQSRRTAVGCEINAGAIDDISGHGLNGLEPITIKLNPKPHSQEQSGTFRS